MRRPSVAEFDMAMFLWTVSLALILFGWPYWLPR